MSDELYDPETHPHDNFTPSVGVQVFRDQQDRSEGIGFIVTLSMVCEGCGAKFTFPGRTGQSFSEPRVTSDGLKLLVPMRPLGVAMPVEQLLDVEATDDRDEAIAAAVRRALIAPASYALASPGEASIEVRTRAIVNSLSEVLHA